MRDIAIITGASSGLGKEFLRQLDMGAGGPIDEFWAIARDGKALDELRASCQTPVKALPLDLTDPSAFETLARELESQGDDLNVQWLVNSAGFGKFGTFQEVADANASMVRLDCLAVVEACYHAILYMHAGSRIVNISSAAALLPQPGLTTYSACKRFVLDFSRALDAEVGDAGIHVTAVCPKFMHTRFLDAPGDHGALDRLLWIGFEDPKDCVAASIRASIRGQRVAITSPDVRAFSVAARLLPTDAAMCLQERIGAYMTKRHAHI